MNEHMKIYEAVRQPPNNALKAIQAGRLKGKSDINPMWRIRALTEQFGAAGIGWYYTIDSQWLEPGANGEISAFCNISLYVKVGDEWSKPIQGTGGSSYIAKESKGLYTSDECYKMALTDAISVACKALGFAADVYWADDKTKYDKRTNSEPIHPPTCEDCGKPITGIQTQSGQKMTAQEIAEKTNAKYGICLCMSCANRRKTNA